MKVSAIAESQRKPNLQVDCSPIVLNFVNRSILGGRVLDDMSARHNVNSRQRSYFDVIPLEVLRAFGSELGVWERCSFFLVYLLTSHFF